MNRPIRLTPPTAARRILSCALALAVSVSTVRADDQIPVTAASDQQPLLRVGQRVRLTAASTDFTGSATGDLVRVGPDALTLVDPENGMQAELPMAAITRVQIGREHRRTRKGLLIGLAIGVLGALAVDSADCGSIYEARPCTSGEQMRLRVMVVGVYAGLGAAIGHRKKTMKWTDASLPEPRSRAVHPVGPNPESSVPPRFGGEPAAGPIAKALRSSVSVGQRVRLSVDSPSFTGMKSGTLLGLGPGGMVLRDFEGGATSMVPLPSVMRIEVSRRSTAARKGALIGGLLGVTPLGLGAPPGTSDGELLLAAAMLAGIGAGLGAWLGSTIKRDHWSAVPMEESRPPGEDLTWQVSPMVSPAARGGGLQLRLSW